MFSPDIHTLIFLMSLSNVLALLLFVLYLVFYKIKNTKINYYIISRLIQSVAWFIFLYWANDLNPLRMILANTFLFLGLSF